MTHDRNGLEAQFGIDPAAQAADHDLSPSTRGGIALGSQILTAEGEMPVEYLSPGDRIITRSGLRTLVAVQARRIAGDLYCIAESVMGVDRPLQDLHVAPGTRLSIRDWRAKAIFGTPTATVEVERLADGTFIRPIRAETTVFVLEFAGAEIVYADGLEIACEAQTARA